MHEGLKTALIFAPLEDHSLLQCSMNFFKIAVPTMISCVFLQLTFLINTVYAGKLNNAAKLAGVGLGTTLINVICVVPLLGMNGAVETLVS